MISFQIVVKPKNIPKINSLIKLHTCMREIPSVSEESLNRFHIPNIIFQYSLKDYCLKIDWHTDFCLFHIS